MNKMMLFMTLLTFRASNRELTEKPKKIDMAWESILAWKLCKNAYGIENYRPLLIVLLLL